jgi:branched-chain amino acid transport system substrate-binding protein
VKKRMMVGLLLVAVSALALVAAGCGGKKSSSSSTGTGGTSGGVKALPAANCNPIQYKGSGDADYLIASDLPLIGSSRTQTLQMSQAITYALQQQDWKAGSYKVAYQSCNDASAQLAKWDPTKCSANANAYKGNSSLLGVIGTFNSGCAAIIIPVLNKAPGGGMLLFSPANTYGCLTEQCSGGEPQKYYPSGKRTYARVAPSDPNQAGVQAKLMKDDGVKTLYILNDKEAYGLGIAKNVRGAAASAGIKVVGFSAYDPKAPNFQATFTKIQNTNPDAIFIGGLVDENSGQLINDKVSILGPNTTKPTSAGGGVMLFLPDGFTTTSIFDKSLGGTTNANGAYFTAPGASIENYKGAALTFIDGFKKAYNITNVQPYAILAGQAAQVLLDAIEKSDGTRAEVIKNVFNTTVTNGLIGSFAFNKNGDITGATGAALDYTVYLGKGSALSTVSTTVPVASLVQAARRAGATAS